MLSLRPKVPLDIFLGVGWGGTAFSLIFLLGRLYTRIHVHRRLYFDDFLVVFAWTLLMINTALWQSAAKYFYLKINVSAGLATAPPNFEELVHIYRVYSVPVYIFFYTGLWVIKVSFLVFFRRLGSMVSRNHVIHWWIVFVFTVATWFIAVGTIPYGCMTGTLAYWMQNCSGADAVHSQRIVLLFNMAMDVITDAAIITIPIHLLWNVRISLKQKLMLMGIFSLTLVVVVVAITRAALILSFARWLDPSWLYLWSSVEQAVSILIACLASFRSLFVKIDPSQTVSRHDAWSWLDISRSPKSLLSKASKVFKYSRYRQGSSLRSLPTEDMSLTGSSGSTIFATKSHNGKEFPGIQVTHETIIVSSPREASRPTELKAWA